jgi:tetratricopeptide (TPR) repeat protein
MARVDEGAGEGSPCEKDEIDYASAFEGGSRQVKERARKLAREREELPLQLTRLRGLPKADQYALVATEPALASWSLAEELIEECLRRVHFQVQEAGDLAELAMRVTARLGAEEHGAGLVEDLRARAWSTCAEVRRSRSDLRGAEDAFVEAEACIARGSGDALEEARVMELEAALQCDRQRIEDAHRLLDAATAIYRRCRDFHLVGRAYIEKGRVFAAAQQLDSALEWVRKGLGLLDSRRDPYLTLAAQHRLMLYLHESGRVQEAWFRLQATRADFAAADAELLDLRLAWLEGNLQGALGMPAESEAALCRARAGFKAQGLGFEAALSGLDLIGLYVEQGRVAEARQIAEEIPALYPHRVPDEAFAALEGVLRAGPGDASKHRRALEESLRRARREHELRFDEPP